MTKDKTREIKGISFNHENKNDNEILNYIESLGVPFGSYVKLLIRKDMNNNFAPAHENNNDEIVQGLKEISKALQNINIVSTGTVTTGEKEVALADEKEDLAEEQTNAIENLLRFSKQ